MTSYIGIADLDFVLDNFVSRYYGSFTDDDPEQPFIGTQFYLDLHSSFDQTNEILSSIPSIKQVPVGTQVGGNYPHHVRMLQSNLMVWNRLRNKHYAEFTDNYPGWINAFKNTADGMIVALRKQQAIFADDTSYGEAGIGIGTFTSKTGVANWYSNWETGFYRASDYPKTYVVQIDGTTSGNVIGSATFKWSKNGAFTWEDELQETSSEWVELEDGLAIRWENVGTGTMQLSVGDRFEVRCTPQNVPQKGGGLRFTTFKRG